MVEEGTFTCWSLLKVVGHLLTIQKDKILEQIKENGTRAFWEKRRREEPAIGP